MNRIRLLSCAEDLYFLKHAYLLPQQPKIFEFQGCGEKTPLKAWGDFQGVGRVYFYQGDFLGQSVQGIPITSLSQHEWLGKPVILHQELENTRC